MYICDSEREKGKKSACETHRDNRISRTNSSKVRRGEATESSIEGVRNLRSCLRFHAGRVDGVISSLRESRRIIGVQWKQLGSGYEVKGKG